MKKKRWFLLLLIAFPSVFWLLLETSTIHSKKLPVYGPKKAISAGDTVYSAAGDVFYRNGTPFPFSAVRFPLLVVGFLPEKYAAEGYRIAGLWEYVNYKKEKIAQIPIVLVTESPDAPANRNIRRLSEGGNVMFAEWRESSYDSLNKSYFAGKPYYIDYSFLVLLDSARHVRGYYDARYASEIKRLAEEYQHLRLKEEKNKLIRENEIGTEK